MQRTRSQAAGGACIFALLLAIAMPARALELGDGLLFATGYGEVRLRGLSDGFRADGAHLSQWANVFNLEAELDLAPNGFGPFSMVQGFLRYQVQYDCVWTEGCSFFPGQRYYGDHANRFLPHYTDGRTSGLIGRTRFESSQRVHGDGGRLVDFREFPLFGNLFDEQTDPGVAEAVFRPVLDHRFALSHVRASMGSTVLPMGPIHPRHELDAIGALAGRRSTTGTTAFRPLTDDLYTPSKALLGRMERFDSFDQNFTESELAWNRGASQQQTKELREAYVDLEMLDGALFFRLGKQTIIWGKTELFGNMDQFNPQDLATYTLPSLEDSRIALWSARMIYSAYSLGPIEDFRVELAANLEPFEPADLGRCGEPYAPFLICQKSAGLFTHGILAVGIAGEDRPLKPWESWKGLELGARVEFRWRDFSIAITDFYGYEDFATPEYFHEYARNVDPATGRPRVAGGTGDCTGAEVDCLGRVSASRIHSANRQMFDVLCAATEGAFPAALEAIVIGNVNDDCALDFFNNTNDIITIISPAFVFALALTDPVNWNASLALTPLNAALFPAVIDLNNGFRFAALTAEQRALLGCGSFYKAANCANLGIDLFNAEASVLLQEFPGFDGPIATRYHRGQRVTLPGARSPFDFLSDPVGFRWDPTVDGCIGDFRASQDKAALKAAGLTAQTLKAIKAAGFADDCNGSNLLVDADGNVFRTEIAVVSENLLSVLVGLSAQGEADCREATPENCSLVQALMSSTGVRRPNLLAAGNGKGRRDFLWHGGSEIALSYNRRNVFGVAVDFTESRTKSSWSLEWTWMKNAAYVNSREPRGYSREDTFNLTVSVDRPTRVNFINSERTIFINSQWFFRYVPSYESRDTFLVDGPLSVLGTLTAFTGFFQDRMLATVTFVYDVASRSGGEIFSLNFRFNDRFSATVGMTSFFGNPRRARIPIRQAVLTNNGNDFTERTNYQGVSVFSDRDEFNISLRYTF